MQTFLPARSATPVIVRVARHEHATARDEVRVGELDLLDALLVDRHRREDQVGRPVLQERDPVVGDRLDELRLDAELGGDRLAHLDVEALDLARLRVLDPERRHVELHADRDLALGLDLAQRRVRRELLARLGRRRRGRRSARAARRGSSSSPPQPASASTPAVSATPSHRKPCMSPALPSGG